MLIRSQDKERLMDYIRASVGIDHEVSEDKNIWISIVYSENACGLLGKYSSEEKALKVLDMIQEAYADAELIPMTVPNIGKMFAEASASKENELLAETIGEALMNKMVFQMPVDSEVVV